MYSIVFTQRAVKDIEKIKAERLTEKAKKLIELMKANPFQNPPPYEKLVGDLKGAFSRRINIKHRLVYTVSKKEKIIKILSLWSHYE